VGKKENILLTQVRTPTRTVGIGAPYQLPDRFYHFSQSVHANAELVNLVRM
jgi:hypothetical protein